MVWSFLPNIASIKIFLKTAGKLGKVDGDQCGDPPFLYCDPVKAVGDLYRLLLWMINQDLGMGDGLLDETVEEADVRVVERRDNLPLSIADGL